MSNSELRKALTIGGTGDQLVREDLEALIRQDLLVLSPLSKMIQSVLADAHIHRVARRTAHIAAGFEGESADASYSESTYDRRSVTMKILRTHGKVTDFQQSASKTFVDSVVAEINSATQGMVDLFEFASLYGMSDDTISTFTGDAYQYTGAYGWFLKDAGTGAGMVDASTETVTLLMLDTMLDNTMNLYQSLRNDPYVFIMSPGMISKISGLETRIQRDVQTIEYEGGFVFATYKGVPLIPSGFVKPAVTTTSPAVTAAADGTTTGKLTDDEYFYQVASITRYGEQIAGTEDSVTLSGGGSTQNIDLTWSADSTAMLYAIYRGLTTGFDNLELIDIIPAMTYTSGIGVSDIAAYDDLTALVATYTDVHPMTTAEETIFLLNLSVENGVSRPVLSPTLGDPIADLIHYIPIPVSDDTHAFRLKSYHALQVPWGTSCAVTRRVKPS